MKRIIIALGIIAVMHAGAEAKDCNCKCKKVVKHTSTAHIQKPKPVAPAGTQGAEIQQVAAENCRVVPYEVCKINPDRRSLSCYKTIDPVDQQPYNDEVITYGPTGDMPGQATKPAPGTVIIPGPVQASYCKRNADDNATVCYSPGGLVRDEFGFYHYK